MRGLGRSTPFRLALQIIAIFGLTLSAGLTVSYLDLRDDLISIAEESGLDEAAQAEITAKQLEELNEVFVELTTYGVLPATLIALITGLFTAARSAKRVEAVRRALRRIADGDLTARVSDMGRDDISEIAAALNESAAAQEQSVAALRDVSAGIAHDLKTPVQRISVSLSELERFGNLPEEAAELVSRMTEETARVTRIFHSLLHISQIEGGADDLEFAPVDLRRLAQTVTELYTPEAEDGEAGAHSLRFDDQTTGPALIKGDETLLGQALANLTENALRHTSGGAITISLAARAGGLALSVSDEGPGVPEEERENVLRRLCRLDKSRHSEGNGLGLTMVAAITRRHHGELTLSDAKPGLCVTMSFATAGGA